MTTITLEIKNNFVKENFSKNDIEIMFNNYLDEISDFYENSLKSLEHYKETGLHVTHDEVKTWLSSLNTDNPLTLPKCHK